MHLSRSEQVPRRTKGGALRRKVARGCGEPEGPAKGRARAHLKDMEDFLPNLVWDADPKDLDLVKHKKYVVQRVLERGTLDDMRHMFAMYGFDDVVATSKTLRSLEPKSLAFIVNLSGQPKEAFRCYALKQLNQAPWIY